MSSAQQPAAQKPTGGLSIAQVVISIAIAVGSTLLTVGFAHGSFSQRLTTVEADLKTKVSVERYDAEQRAARESLDSIRITVEAIRRDQVEDLKRRAEHAESLRTGAPRP